VVGHFGVGFFGVMELPVATCGMGWPPACAPIDLGGTLPAPSIGARYWASDALGLEGGIGLHLNKTSTGGNDESGYGFALHAGVPLALAHAGNFVFEAVPQMNLGFAWGSFNPAGAPGEINVKGFLIEAGAKVGAEIHFGFIELPQLSLQGTLGLMIRHESRSATTPAVGGGPRGSADGNSTDISTGVDDAPWRIFTGALTAIYYFGV
jgi:hypothetical protein